MTQTHQSARTFAQWVSGLGYCYMDRNGAGPRQRHKRKFDGMIPERPTAIEAFGFTVTERDGFASFTQVRDSTATYPDGKPRRWQDPKCYTFWWPLVKRTNKRKES